MRAEVSINTDSKLFWSIEVKTGDGSTFGVALPYDSSVAQVAEALVRLGVRVKNETS